MTDQVGIRLEQLGRVRQAARRDDPGGAGLARSQGGSGGINSGHVPPWLDERLGQQGGPVQAALAVDVLGILGQAWPLEGRRGARVDGDALVLPDGSQHARGIPRRFPVEHREWSATGSLPFLVMLHGRNVGVLSSGPGSAKARERRAAGLGPCMLLGLPMRAVRDEHNPGGCTYSKGALPKTVDMPKSLMPG